MKIGSLFPPDIGPGPDGKVWRITFDEKDKPRPPEVASQGGGEAW